jgi:glycosyltransferase involved in cell wall biosynthesis
VKLNWFSPLPPAPTDIAHYTARILPALAARADVTLWTNQTKWDRNLERYAPVRSFQHRTISWPEVHRGGLSIYNIGNSGEFHGAIWEICRQNPGVVILHDLCLQHLFAAVYLEQRCDRCEYLAVMQRYYGRQGEKDADDYCNQHLSTEYMGWVYPLTHHALENALGVVVHTQPAAETLRIENRWPLTSAPLPYVATPRPRAPRRGGPPYRLVVLGYLGRNRRLDQILQALAEFPERDAFRLDIYGRIWDPAAVRARVQKLRLDRYVTLHGFVAEDKLDEALEAAHLALNLRYPSVGEASGGQLRAWDHALPSLVTRTGWYATLPGEAVAFVNPEQEVAELQEHWRTLLADPQRFARMGEAGRRILEREHAPEDYVQTLLDFIGTPEQMRLHASARSLAERVGAEMSAWMSRDQADALLRPAAEQIRALAL